MNEQIDQMQEIIGSCMEVQDEVCREFRNCSTCKASRLYDAGFRKRLYSKWEISCDGYYPYCKNCGYEPPYVKETDMRTKFCPECGAEMDETTTRKKQKGIELV